MAIDFTENQKKAATEKGNVLVSAAAGSGKTAVLVKRVIDMITDTENPVNPENLLVVTFTNAAAEEMRGRIESSLYSKIKENPKNKKLIKQRQRLANADICTIDSFCIKLIRENFSQCGVSPDFRVSDDTMLSTINNEVLEGIWEPLFKEKSPAFLKLLKITQCEYDFDSLAALIKKIFEKAMIEPFPKEYINGLYYPYAVSFDNRHPWWNAAFEIAENDLSICLENAISMNDCALKIENKTEKYIDYAYNLTEMLKELSVCAKKRDYDSFYGMIHEAGIPNLSKSANKEDPAYIAFRDKRTKISNDLKNLCELFYCDSKTVENDLFDTLDAVKLLSQIICEYYDKLFERYCEENVLTFSFAEQLALGLLCSYENGEIVLTDTAKAVISRYSEVLVDEYQDINDLQDTLFNVLSDSQKHLFTVGDVKQCIYGFRGSNPQNFLNKKLYAKREDTEAKGIVLSENFRSRPGVCDAVNYLFSLIMSGQCGPIVYGAEEELKPQGKFPEINDTAVDVLMVSTGDEEDKRLVCEAKAIAAYIKSLMAKSTFVTEDNNTKRLLKMSDIAILSSSLKNKGVEIARVLLENGIPVSFSPDAFLESSEITFVLSLLKVIGNPRNNLELLEVMLSPYFGFSSDSVAAAKAKDKYGVLYNAVINEAKQGNEKFASFVAVLSEFRRASAVMSVDALIDYIYAETDLINRVSAVAGSGIKRNNLITLSGLAKEYSQYNNGGIYGFLNYIANLPIDAFKGGGVNDGGVKLMTMHGSKGLQFPVCILANLSGQFNRSDERNRILYNKELGIAFKYFDYDTDDEFESIGKKAISDYQCSKNVEEGLRKLYVACTRAIDKLVLVCALDKDNKMLSNAANNLTDTPPYISSRLLKKASCMSEWILPALLMHPDGERLRKGLPVDIKVLETKSGFNVIFADEIEESQTEKFEELLELKPNKEGLAELISSAAQYKYPYENLKNISSKISVSAAANGREAELFAFSAKPAFMLENGLTAAGRGTAMHHIMQFIEIDEKPDVKKEIKRLTEMQFITSAQAKAADIPAIERFFESDIYERIRKSGKIRREMRFLSEIPLLDVYDDSEDLPEDSQILVQGAVDLCFIEDDGAIVLDFKTDRVEDMQTLADRYKKQLDIYAAACERVLNMPVKKKIIYSFTLSDSIEF